MPEADPVLPLARADDPAGVIVIGAGPVGMTLALGLVRAGVPVTVLEQDDQLAAQSRASTFHAPTLEILDELGIVDALMAIGLQAPVTQFRDRMLGPVADLDMAILHNDTRYPFRIQCEQHKLCQLILPLLPPDTVRYGHSVTAVENDPDGSVAVMADTPDGPVVLHGRAVVGADGAHSAVRRSLGIDFEGLTYPERFLVVSTTQPMHELLPGLQHVNYVADPDEWLVLLRTPDHWRVLFPTDPDASDDEVLDEAVIEARLQGVAPLPHRYPVLHTTLYKVHRRVAVAFRKGAVALAGDAAHINSPLGGMGMNSGIQDACALWRRLARVWAGSLRLDEALDDYDRRRRPVAIEYVGADTHKNWQVLREPDPVKRKAYQDELRATAADPVRLRQHLLRTSMLDAVRDSL